MNTGDVILVHSSLDSLRGYQDSPDDVIDMLFALIGAAGTLAMPAFSYTATPQAFMQTRPRFVVTQTPCVVGVVNEVFRRWPHVVRSWHPTHSVAALGPLATWLVEDHLSSATPFHPLSPLAKLDRVEGKIVFLGADYRRHLTHVHVGEDILGDEFPVPVYAPGFHEAVVVPPDKVERVVRLRVHDPKVFEGISLEPITNELKARRELRIARVSGVTIALASAAATTQVVLELARKGVTVYRRKFYRTSERRHPNRATV